MIQFDAHLFVSLFAAHLIGDFVMQTRYDVLYKKHLPVLFKHAFTVAILSWLFAGSMELWIILPWIGITHAATDYVKAVYGDALGEPFGMFLLDQAVHIAVIILTAFAVPELFTYESVWLVMFGDQFIQALIILSGVILAVRVAGIVIGIWIGPMLQLMDEQVRGQFESSSSIIGQLERLLIFFFVFTGLYSGVGFLLGAKALFRMGTLIDRTRRYESEYVIVGTLISFTWALIFSWLAFYLLSMWV
jgi:hypothetical protein